MKEVMLNLSRRLSIVFKEKTNIIIMLLVVNLWLVAYVYVEIMNGLYHYYMNSKTSIEQVHNVKIDSYNGQIEKQLSTEEQLIRKNNRRFHLYYFLKNFI